MVIGDLVHLRARRRVLHHECVREQFRSVGIGIDRNLPFPPIRLNHRGPGGHRVLSPTTVKLAKEVALDSGLSMPSAVATTVRKKALRRRPSRNAAKPRVAVIYPVRLDLDVEELALHAAISAAVARDLGR